MQSCGTARSGSRPGGYGIPGCVTQRRPSPGRGRRTSGRPACGGRASSPSGWRRGWSGNSWTSSCTACTACTLWSSPPAWLQAAGTRRATGSPCSRTSCGRGPATPSLGTTSSAPSRGMQSATSRASGRGPRRAGGGPRTSSTTWSGGQGHWPGCWGQRKCPGLSWPWTTRPFAGRALLASPDHRMRGTRLLLGERAQILRKAAGLVERHLVAGTLLCSPPLGAVSLSPPLGRPRVCWPVGPPLFCGTPRGDAAAYALLGLLGPEPAGTGPHAAATG